MAAAYEWAVRFPGSDINHIQASESAARAVLAQYPDHPLALLYRPADVYTEWRRAAECGTCDDYGVLDGLEPCPRCRPTARA